MIFKTYNSIENAYQARVIEQITMQGFGDEVFIVQEKVHGANFSFFTDGKEIKIAKRTAFIEKEEKFFNAHQVLELYKGKVIEAFGKVKSLYPEVEMVVIYGELFGGGYKHKAVDPVKDAIKVQKGIEYAPYNEFYAFDIKLNGTTYLDTEVINRIFLRRPDFSMQKPFSRERWKKLWISLMHLIPEFPIGWAFLSLKTIGAREPL